MSSTVTCKAVLLAHFCVPLAFLFAGCGGPTRPPEVALTELRTAIDTPVASSDDAAERSRVVERVLGEDALRDLTRGEVEAAIGRGDPCSRHPRCAEQGFESDDWFYTVGAPGDESAGMFPQLILGFDHTGRVSRVWNLQTH